MAITLQRVCVFCGSSSGARAAYRHAARDLGRELAHRGIGVVFGGGAVGLMGTLADAALAAGGEVIGVIPRPLARKEVAHPGLTQLHLVHSMHERKAMMAELCSAFVALPGGVGTLEEVFEVVTWAVLGIHRKPFGLLNVQGYWNPLLALLDHAVEESFVRADHRSLLLASDDVGDLLQRLAAHEPPALPQWIESDET